MRQRRRADPLYDEAAQFVLTSRRASIRRAAQLRIGYNRAARLIEQMEAAGLVSPMGRNGTREVLAPGRPTGEPTMTATTGNLLRDVPVHASAEIFADLMAWQAAGRASSARLERPGQRARLLVRQHRRRVGARISGSAAVEVDDGTTHTRAPATGFICRPTAATAWRGPTRHSRPSGWRSTSPRRPPDPPDT
jgi:hypothetical protein